MLSELSFHFRSFRWLLFKIIIQNSIFHVICVAYLYLYHITFKNSTFQLLTHNNQVVHPTFHISYRIFHIRYSIIPMQCFTSYILHSTFHMLYSISRIQNSTFYILYSV